MQVRGGRIEPGLNPEGLSRGDGLLQPRLQFFFPDNIVTALLDQS
jgi:hypothetical protein